LPGRTENSIKNHWNATKRRQYSKRKCRSKYPRGTLLQDYIKSLNLDQNPPRDFRKRSSANARPSKTLFVINFDTYHTRTRDLERHFEPYGKIVSVRIRRNFAFVQYDSEDDASKALEATNNR
jgi:RNA recognition motif-containing protein